MPRLCFESKQVDWVRFEVTDGVGLELGLSEIEVFPSSKSYPRPDFMGESIQR